MDPNFLNLFTGTFYIHEGYALSCLATIYTKFAGISYADKDEADIIQGCISKADSGSSESSGQTVAVLSFKQPVMKYGYGGWLGTQTYMKILDSFKADSSIAAVVLDMDSGGGQVYGTPEFYDYLVEFRKSKPIGTYTNGLLCSGAYYIAAATDFIVANKRADAIGSIGAYSTIVDMNGLLSKLGATVHTIYATDSTEKNKAYREVIEKGDYKNYIKSELDPIVETFVDDMKAARPQLKEGVFKGGTWPGQQALEMGLVDEIGTMDTAIAKAFGLSKGNSNTKNQKKKSMSKNKSLPKIQKVLGISGDMKIVTKAISGKKGVFIEEAQLDAIESSMVEKDQAVAGATAKVTAAESKVTALDTAVDNAIESAGLTAEVPAGATTEAKITLLQEKVVEYGAQPGSKGSKAKSEGDRFDDEDEGENSTSIYNSIIGK